MPANTEDIAEKVADLFWNQTLKTAAMVTNVVPEIISGTGQISSGLLGSAAQELKNKAELRKLLNMDGEVAMSDINELVQKLSQKSSAVYVGDADAKEYGKLLDDKGVVYAKLDRQDDNCKMFVFLTKDEEKVKDASQILMARRGVVSELKPDLYFNSLSPDKIHAVEGLSSVEMELYRHYAREDNLLFTAITNQDRYTVVCDREREQQARKTLLKVGWALSGENGDKVRAQVENRLRSRQTVQRSIDEPEQELYVVSQNRPGQHIHISRDGFSSSKQNKVVNTVTRQDPDFFTKCMAACEGIQQPVVLSPSQYREDLKGSDLEKAITMELFPKEYEERKEMNQLNQMLDLVSQKSSLDENQNTTWGIWDPSISYSEFAAGEAIMDEDEKDLRESAFEHFKKAAYYSKEHHTHLDIDMEEKNLDYLIEKAEEKRREYAESNSKEHSKGRQGFFDIVNR